MYKTLLFIAMLSLTLGSCKSKKETKENTNTTETTKTTEQITYRTIDIDVVEALNKIIETEGLQTPEEIMKTYSPILEGEEATGDYSVQFTTNDLDPKTKEITKIETALPDDSIHSLMVVIILTNEDGNWKVSSIKESYKCAKDRGHENWGAELCL